MSTTTISGLPTKTPTGAEYIPIEDSSSTGKATINNIVGKSADVTTLKSRFEYKSSVSLDTLTDSGLYWVDNATGGPPEAAYTTWIVIAIAAGDWGKQIATCASNNGVRYERLRSSGTWGDWMLIQDRFLVQSNSSKTITLPAWKNYLVSCSSHLWLVMMQNSSTTPVVVSLYSGESTYRTCVGVSGQPKITLGNTSSSTYSFGIVTTMV